MQEPKYPFPEAPGLPLLRCEIVLSGDSLEPQAVQKAVPLDGAEAARRGERRREPLPPCPETHWRYFVALETQLLDDALRALLDRIEPYRSQLVMLGKQPGVSSWILTSATLTRDGCIYELSPQTLGRLAAFEVPFVLDIYDYIEEEDISDLLKGREATT